MMVYADWSSSSVTLTVVQAALEKGLFWSLLLLPFVKKQKAREEGVADTTHLHPQLIPSLEELWMEMLDGENFLCVHFDVFYRCVSGNLFTHHLLQVLAVYVHPSHVNKNLTFYQSVR